VSFDTRVVTAIAYTHGEGLIAHALHFDHQQAAKSLSSQINYRAAHYSISSGLKPPYSRMMISRIGPCSVSRDPLSPECFAIHSAQCTSLFSMASSNAILTSSRLRLSGTALIKSLIALPF